MMTRALFIISFLVNSIYSNAQLIATPSTNAQQIVQELIGSGISISNIKSKGSIGFFNNGQSSIGINEGIILSTGNVSDANGPNESIATTGFIGSGGDSDLADYINESDLYDAAVIEFDFVPQSDEVSVSYVFGSDEYPEFVCTPYNDGFAFLISGPGITGQVNIAQLPNTNIPVSINNINDGLNSCGPDNSAYYIDNTSDIKNIEFDGLTTPLTASIDVIPCQSYHIKLVIADVGDDWFDSGVMLEKGSFKSGNVSVNSISFSQHFSYAIEGCNKNAFVFTRDQNLDIPLTLELNIEGTAINGVDYTQIADSIHFDPFQDSVSLIIDPISDSIDDQIEFVIITLKEGCNTSSKVDTIFIRDFFSILDTTYKICQGTTIQLNEDYEFPTDQFTWSPGSSLSCSDCQSPISSPNATTKYYVTATDSVSGCFGNDSIDVEVIEYPNVSLFGKTLLCNKPSSEIRAIKDIKDDIDFLWFRDNNLIKESKDSLLSINSTGVYHVVATHKSLCSDTSNFLDVEFLNVIVDAGPDQTIVYGETTNLQGTSTVGANNIWGTQYESSIYNPNNLTTLVEPKSTAQYTLIDSLKGCFDSDQVTIHVRLFIPTAISPNGDGANDSWHILGLEEISDYQIRVRNRYGNIVFESIASYIPWNGTKNNKPLPVGTYYYTIETTDKQEYSGSLTILR